jgi:antitoxin YefM
MIVISSREFRDNQKKYLDMVDNNQHIIIKRGKDKAYVLSPVSEEDRYFMDPEVKAHINEGIADYKAGRVVKLTREERKKLLGL